MQDRKRETGRRFAERRRGLVPEKTSDYSYLYYYSTLRDGMQWAKKSSAKRVFTGSYGILTNRP